MRTTNRRLTQTRRGAAVVEMAILSPLFVLVTLGAVEIGQFVNTAQLVSNACREGARKATRDDVSAVAEVETIVQNYLGNAGIPISSIQVTVMNSSRTQISGGDLSTIASGELLSVQVNVDFEPVRPIAFLDLLDGASNSTTSTARRE